MYIYIHIYIYIKHHKCTSIFAASELFKSYLVKLFFLQEQEFIRENASLVCSRSVTSNLKPGRRQDLHG